MRISFCGVRGSTPVAGPEYLRYGGATSCVALAHDGSAPTLVLDGGTGLRRLSRQLGSDPFAGTILLGHLHWDHTHGLPFFAAAERPGGRVDVLLPCHGDPVEVLGRAFGPPHFPLRPDALRGRWRYQALAPGVLEVEGFTVLVRTIPHLDSVTYGFRVSDGRNAVAYLSDHNPVAHGDGPEGLGVYHDEALELVDGVDLLIHDAQHTAAEYAAKSFLGHATPDYAVGLGRLAGAKRVVLFHHDPDRTDDEVDAMVAEQQGRGVAVGAAAEGMWVDLVA